MDKFWELMEKNVLVSSLLAAGLVGAVIFLAVTGKPIPEIIAALCGTVVGYFFGAKVQQATNSAAARRRS